MTFGAILCRNWALMILEGPFQLRLFYDSVSDFITFVTKGETPVVTIRCRFKLTC